MLFQPGKQIGIDFLAVGLVEDFVPGAGVKLHGHIFTAGIPEETIYLFHALTHGAHRVRIPGEQAHGRLFVHFRQVLFSGDVLQARHHGVVHARPELVTLSSRPGNEQEDFKALGAAPR